MNPIKGAVCLSAMVTLAGALAAAESRHDLYLAAAINKNYVIGSKLVTTSGLFRRTDDGSFQHFGVNFPYVFAVAFDPRDRQAIYTASLNGVLLSKDGGESWRIATGWDMTEAKDISVDPNAPDHVYVALPDGIAVSRDRGATWARKEQGLPERGKYTQALQVDRTQAGRALAACEAGIYLTSNGAESWKRVFAAKATVTDVRQSPHNPKLWLSSTQNDGVLASNDGGLSWKKFEQLPSDEAFYNVGFDATNPQRYAVSSWTYGVMVTEDAGKTWSDRNAGLPDEHCVYRVAIDPDTSHLYASVYKDALFVSDDFGRTWKNAGMEGSTIHSFAFVPARAR
ncbi:MAG: YCF48-related protein [Opitutus sp.]